MTNGKNLPTGGMPPSRNRITVTHPAPIGMRRGGIQKVFCRPLSLVAPAQENRRHPGRQKARIAAGLLS